MPDIRGVAVRHHLRPPGDFVRSNRYTRPGCSSTFSVTGAGTLTSTKANRLGDPLSDSKLYRKSSIHLDNSRWVKLNSVVEKSLMLGKLFWRVRMALALLRGPCARVPLAAPAKTKSVIKRATAAPCAQHSLEAPSWRSVTKLS